MGGTNAIHIKRIEQVGRGFIPGNLETNIKEISSSRTGSKPILDDPSTTPPKAPPMR